jgi:NADH dehydrogenase FAD-containing subunit
MGELVQLLEAPDAAPRNALPSEIRWFYEAARDVVPVEAEGQRIDIEALRTRLSQEIDFFVDTMVSSLGWTPTFQGTHEYARYLAPTKSCAKMTF